MLIFFNDTIIETEKNYCEYQDNKDTKKNTISIHIIIITIGVNNSLIKSEKNRYEVSPKICVVFYSRVEKHGPLLLLVAKHYPQLKLYIVND